MSALMASVSAIDMTSAGPSLELHTDGKCKGTFRITSGDFILWYKTDDAAWGSAGVVDLEALLTAQAKELGHEWKDEMVLKGDCRPDWGSSGCYIKLKGDDNKYCEGMTSGSPLDIALAVQPPAAAIAAGGTAGTIRHPRQEEPGANHPWQRPKVPAAAALEE